MNASALLNFIDLFAFVANGLIVMHILASWFQGLRRIPGYDTAIGMAELILLPVRKLIPPRGPLDWSPLVTIIGLQVAQSLLHSLLS